VISCGLSLVRGGVPSGLLDVCSMFAWSCKRGITFCSVAQRRRRLKRLWTGSCDFPTNSCKFPKKEIWMLKHFNLAPKFSQKKAFSPVFCILCRTRLQQKKTIFRLAQIYGATTPLCNDATAFFGFKPSTFSAVFVSERRHRGVDLWQLFLVLQQALRTSWSHSRL